MSYFNDYFNSFPNTKVISKFKKTEICLNEYVITIIHNNIQYKIEFNYDIMNNRLFSSFIYLLNNKRISISYNNYRSSKYCFDHDLANLPEGIYNCYDCNFRCLKNHTPYNEFPVMLKSLCEYISKIKTTHPDFL